MDFLMILAIVPGIVFLFLVWKLDKIEKEPLSLVGKLVFLGFFSIVPTLILESIADMIATSIFDMDTVLYLLVDNFLCVALIEEGMKYFFLKKFTWKSKEFDYLFDGIVYAVCIGMGFAILENIFYVADDGLGTAVARAFTSIPGHGVFAITMGHYYGMARFHENRGNGRLSKRWRTKALLIPVLVHGFYDFTLSFDSELMIMVFFIFISALFVRNYRMVRNTSKRDFNIE